MQHATCARAGERVEVSSHRKGVTATVQGRLGCSLYHTQPSRPSSQRSAVAGPHYRMSEPERLYYRIRSLSPTPLPFRLLVLKHRTRPAAVARVATVALRQKSRRWTAIDRVIAQCGKTVCQLDCHLDFGQLQSLAATGATIEMSAQDCHT